MLRKCFSASQDSRASFIVETEACTVPRFGFEIWPFEVASINANRLASLNINSRLRYPDPTHFAVSQSLCRNRRFFSYK